MRHRLTEGMVALAVSGLAGLGAVVGQAASLDGETRTLGGGTVPIARCDTDGFTIVENMSGANVVSVTVGQIAAACATATVSLTLASDQSSSAASGTVPAGGGSLTVTLAAAVAATDSDRVDIVVAGP